MTSQAAPTAAAVQAPSLEQLSFHRAAVLAEHFRQKHGLTVLNGPMRGMEFVPQASEGCYLPKLMGVYEQPLHPHIEAAIARGYGKILNIGCAEGYYAVGFARRMPTVQVEAFDIAPHCMQACGELVRRNAMADRVAVRGAFTSFEAYRGQRPLVFCDIEGAELELLDPEQSPALREMDVIVEAHECYRPGIAQAIATRFTASHDITLVTDDGLRTFERRPPWFNGLRHLDQLLCTWEWRGGPTPWLVMRAKA